MVRDFTTEMEEKLYEYVNTRDENIEFSSLVSNLEIERYSENCEDMEYMLSNLDTYHQSMLDNAFISKQFIETVFDRVRQYDLDFSNTVTQGMSMTLDPYKKAMNALLDSIRVSESNGTSSSIFVESNIFQDKINGIACGLVGEAYLRLQDDEAFAELMTRSPEEIKVWEMMALVKMVDDCLEMEENGRPVLNFERYAAFIEKGYIQTEIRDATFVSYSPSPAMKLLAEYLNIRADMEIETYLDTNDNCIDDIRNCCYQADILTAIITYYDQIKSSYNKSFHLEIAECVGDENLLISEQNVADLLKAGKIIISEQNVADLLESGKLLISAQSNADEFEEITIFSYSKDITDEMLESEFISKKSKFISTQEMVWECMGGQVAAICMAKILESAVEELPGVSTAKNIYEGAVAVGEVGSSYQAAQEQNERTLQEMEFKELQRALRLTYCGGTVIQCGDNISVQHIHMDERKVLTDVSIYNAIISKEPVTPIAVQEVRRVKRDLDMFLESGEMGKSLKALINFDQGDPLSKNAYDDYKQSVNASAEQEGIKLSTATYLETLELLEELFDENESEQEGN